MGKSPIESITELSARNCTPVEREILRCAAIGEVADFTNPKWRRVKRIDGKPAVSGKFLSDLWLGTQPVEVHPQGIKISGLHIEGAVSVYGARTGEGTNGPLPRFNVKHSVFSNGLDISESRCETIYASDCVFHQLPPGEFYQDGDVLSLRTH